MAILKPSIRVRKLERLCRLKISLDGIRPQIWRRIVVPQTIPLFELHEIFQITMGWTESHLHRFEAYGLEYQVDYGEFDRDDVPLNEDEATLNMLAEFSGDQFTYVYDFGDNWEHTITLERHYAVGSFAEVPICIDGANSAPPEDCGGKTGYGRLRTILRNPLHAEYADYRRWAGRKFNPRTFDSDAVNKRLVLYRKKRRLTEAMLPDIRGT